MPTSLKSALLLVAPLFVSTLTAQPFATSVVNYSPGTGGAAGYSDPTSALGAPSTEVPGFPSGLAPVTPFNPAFLQNQLVSIGAGGSLTLGFADPILNAPGNPFGLDFSVYGNNGFTITNGDFTGGGVTDGTLFTFDPTGTSRIFVSADNIDFFELIAPPGLATQLDALFPTDATGNFQQPADPSLRNEDFAGGDLAAIRALYGGSAGGTGFDLSWARTVDGQAVDLAEARFLRIEVLSGKIEVDGVAIVPEPGTWALIVLGLAVVAPAARRRSSLIRRSAMISTGFPPFF